MANSLNNLAELYAALDDFIKAHDLYKRGQMIDNKLIDQVMGFTSEDQKIKFLSMKKWDLYAFLSLINQHLKLETPPTGRMPLMYGSKERGLF